MTDQIDTPASAPVEVAPERVQFLDPRSLLVDRNVRLTTDADQELVNSVRDHGVLQPITVVRTVDGQARVRFGHRRTFAAIEADRPLVPVIVAGDEATDSEGDIDRILKQLAENEARVALSNPDRVSAFEQLALLGMTPDQIATRTGRGHAEVSAALAVAKSRTAQAVVSRYEFLGIEEAAAVGEFEDDPETVKALVVAAQTGRFDHVLQAARDRRAEAVAREAVAAPLREAGLTLIERTRYNLPSGVERLDCLVHIETGEPVTFDEHTKCPGHAAVLDQEWQERSTEDSEAPEDSDGADDETAEESEHIVWVPVYVCQDPRPNGHCASWERRSVLADKETADLSAQERAAQEEAVREASRRERRDVIESNKAWRSATQVRRRWLAKLPARKTAPKGVAAFVAVAQVADPTTLADIKGNHYAANLLGCDKPTYGHSAPLAELVEKAPATRVTLLHLVVVLAAYEHSLHDGTWRSESPTATRYLTYLESIGYPLSAIEQRAIGRKERATTPDAESKGAAESKRRQRQAAATTKPTRTRQSKGATTPAASVETEQAGDPAGSEA